MKIRNAVPHLFTSGNLLCGCIAIVKAFEGDLVWSAYLVGIAAILDFFDGFVARALKVQGEFGKQLDSLADCVTFGVVPGVVMAQLIWYADILASPSGRFTGVDHIPFGIPHSMIGYTAFLIPIFSALRLAKFNLDTRQSDSFIGVPTPANSILICSFPLILFHFCEVFETPVYNQEGGFYACFRGEATQYQNVVRDILLNVYFLLSVTIIMSFLLVAELPLFALKFKNFKWRGNEIRYSFLLLSVLFLVFFKFVGLPLIIILYILMSIGNNIFGAKKIHSADN